MRSNIIYHTRLYGNNSVKCSGGSFHGLIDVQTVERLVNMRFTVRVKPSGTPVFVDREGREVYLYLSVAPETTDKGKEALKAWREERNKRFREQVERDEEQEQELQEIVSALGHDEAMRRLKGEKP